LPGSCGGALIPVRDRFGHRIPTLLPERRRGAQM